MARRQHAIVAALAIGPHAPRTPSATVLARVLGELKIAVFVFQGARQVYANRFAEELAERLQRRERSQLRVMLLDHLARLERGRERARRSGPSVALLTSAAGEHFYIDVFPIERRAELFAVAVRSTGTHIDAFRRRYGLSPREAEVAELVLRGYGNREIANQLDIALTTVKKHLTRVFDKVGVDSRAQLMARMA